MLRQSRANIPDRVHQRVGESLILKVLTHSFDDSLPQLLAASLMNGLVTNHRELVRAGRNKDQNRRPMPGFVHTELVKPLLCGHQRIAPEFSTLNIDPEIRRRFLFRLPNRGNDAIVLKLA
jgi:hypothetical protein